MAAKRPNRGPRKTPGPGGKPRHSRPVAPANTVRARRVHGDADAWELVHPRCARDRADDLEEVRKMLDAGEIDVAIDECRWLLEGCTDCLDAHRMLGEVALEIGDLPLARAHFGYAFRLGTQALAREKTRGPLPYRIAANQGFLESAKGLTWCLKQMHKPDLAAEVVEEAIACDPADPLGLAQLLAAPVPAAKPASQDKTETTDTGAAD